MTASFDYLDFSVRYCLLKTIPFTLSVYDISL